MRCLTTVDRYTRSLTFKDCAERYMVAHEAGWRNAKHRAQWRSTLKTYAFPVLGELSIAAIDTPLVMKRLEPIWEAKPETAGRMRGRIEVVLDWAGARKYRTGDNPAAGEAILTSYCPLVAKWRASNTMRPYHGAIFQSSWSSCAPRGP
jgi:hypothetical protein